MKFIYAFLMLLPIRLVAQQLTSLSSGENISIRGLSVVDDRTIWVSGTQGKVGLSTDGGNSWTWHQVKGFERTDFRDIEAFDAKTAVIMGIDSPGVVLKTFNAGIFSERLISGTPGPDIRILASALPKPAKPCLPRAERISEY